MNHHRQQQAHGIHHDVPLASGYPFASVVALRPPFSVVFTDWLSIIQGYEMAALGVASRPAASRTRPRRVSSTRSPDTVVAPVAAVPPTVPQGGRSWGIIRQAIPPRSTYRMPLTTSHRSVVLGGPLLVSGGSRGANSSHWALVPPRADWIWSSAHASSVTSIPFSSQETPAHFLAIAAHTLLQLLRLCRKHTVRPANAILIYGIPGDARVGHVDVMSGARITVTATAAPSRRFPNGHRSPAFRPGSERRVALLH